MVNKDAEYWINKLHLQKHPEGGYFVETFKSEKVVNLSEYDGPRHICSAIYYLLEGDQFSSFHIMKSVGADIDNLEIFQAVIKSGSWFAASINNPNSYSLIGCTVSPGFDYTDWRLGDKQILFEMYPQHKSIIEKYSRPISEP